jgi:hypothetical protein
MPTVAETLPSVQPFFEGWYKNPDGTVTLSFGYINRKTVPVEVPIGPDNSFSPAPINRGQPTVFYPGRDLNVVLIVVPGNFAGNVQWTVKTDGLTSTTTDKGGLNVNYIISELPPKVVPTNAPARPEAGPALATKVGTPLKLSATVRANAVLPPGTTITNRWTKRTGPGDVTFNPPDAPDTSATFSAPGTYLVRLTATRPSGMDTVSGSADFRVVVQ